MTQNETQNWNEGVSIIVPTYQRPDGIEIALGSLLDQQIEGRCVEIIVADNDPAGSARAFVESFKKRAAFDVVYVHVPQPGVSNARNGAMEKARGRFIAFLDDDMEALEGWVQSLIDTSLKFKAGIVFGPAIARMPNPEDARNPYMEPFFSRIADMKNEGLMNETLGTGGCLLDLDLCNMPSPAFDTSLNETGGEDDILFDHLRQTGTKVAWSPKAESIEIVPAKRATPEYIWTRNFAFGQGPSHIHASRGLKGIPGVIYFMATGSIQWVLFGIAYLVMKRLGHPAYVKYLARTARGLGKIFWTDRFSPKLYGAAVLKKPEVQAAE
ncbi:MAG: glycosyltransferase family 2 protein [Hellea sp.]|nr:glycosyltransferase family 2 protein [Hellea sp.]